MSLRLVKIGLPVLILAVALIVLAALILTKQQPEVKSTAEKAWNVAVMAIQKKSYTPDVILYGRVESPRQSNLRSAVEADVAATPVLEGHRINKDDLLIKFDPSDAKLLVQQRQGEVASIEAEIATEKIRYDTDLKSLTHEKELVRFAERQVKRLDELVRKQAGAEAALDDAKEDLNEQELTVRKRELEIENYKNRLAKLDAQLVTNKALLGQAELDLKRTQIRSPFNGRVAKLRVSVGNRVMPGDRVIDVFDDEALEVRAQIPAQYVATISSALNRGDNVIATTEMSGQIVKLVCDRLSAQVSEGRTGVEALFRVVQGGQYLPLGRTVELVVDLPAINDVVALPTSALYGLDRIYIVENDRLQAVQVERVGTIIEQGKRGILVKSAELQNADEVITTQLPNAITGLKVKVIRE